jgi:hypothetical protein
MAVVTEIKEESPATNGTEKTAVQTNGDAAQVAKVYQPGMESEIKDLFQGPEDNRGRWTWTETKPELEKAAEDETTKRYAILVRHKKVYGDSRKMLEIDSIVIQSPLLKTVLGKVLANYPGKFLLIQSMCAYIILELCKLCDSYVLLKVLYFKGPQLIERK